MREIAYVLKAYPRLSEPYITGEIHRVEQAGMKMRLFAIKPVEEWERQARYPCGRACGFPEEIHEDGFLRHGVLVSKDANGSRLLQNF